MESSQKINSVYEKLKEEILYLELAPGQLVGEIETAERFHVSRTPVRSAFKQLESDGLLEIKSHIGTYVSLIDLEQITDVLFMREILELEIMTRLAYSMTEIQEFRLNYLLKKQEELFEMDLPERKLAREFFQLDNELHQTMFDFVGRSQVYVLLKSLEKQYERFRMFLNLTDKETLHNLYLEHREIVKCITTKNIADLKPVFSNHIYGGIHRGLSKVYEHPEYFKSIDKIGSNS